MAHETAAEFGFKYEVGSILAHVAEALNFGAPTKTFVLGAIAGVPRGYSGHAFVVLSCHLELCSGGVQRTYHCRMADPGMVSSAQTFHEHELTPWADAVASVRARQEDEKKPD